MSFFYLRNLYYLKHAVNKCFLKIGLLFSFSEYYKVLSLVFNVGSVIVICIISAHFLMNFIFLYYFCVYHEMYFISIL